MNLTSKRNIKNLLKKYQVHPSKRLGQHFLIDKGVIRKIIKSADLQPNDIVLEIGPGIGVLTQELAKRVKRVVAVEKDPKMIEVLKEMLECWNVRNVKIVNKDILKYEVGSRKEQRTKIFRSSDFRLQTSYKVVGNLPFYLTAPVIRKFLESSEVQPRKMVLVVQKEVGQRICAKPPKMSILSVSVQVYAKPEIISYISKKSFWPQPKVDSALIKITPFQQDNKFTMVKRLSFRELFFRVVRAGFSQPRKQILNNLSKGLVLSTPKGLKLNKEKVKSWLLKNNIQPSQRAETLTIEDWLNLTKSVKID